MKDRIVPLMASPAKRTVLTVSMIHRMAAVS